MGYTGHLTSVFAFKHVIPFKYLLSKAPLKILCPSGPMNRHESMNMNENAMEEIGATESSGANNSGLEHFHPL
jgi:hypothetical protein